MEKLALLFLAKRPEPIPIKKILLFSSAITIFTLIPTAFAEQHDFTNTLPNYLEIEQGDVIEIPKYSYHRLIKGNTKLILQIEEK